MPQHHASLSPSSQSTDHDAAHARARAINVVHAHLAAAYQFALALGDPSLAGYIRAVSQRAARPVVPEAPDGTRSARIMAERRAIQEDGWSAAVSRLDAWADNPDDDSLFADVARDIYQIGVAAGVDSIIPEWSEQFMPDLLSS